MKLNITFDEQNNAMIDGSFWPASYVIQAINDSIACRESRGTPVKSGIGIKKAAHCDCTCCQIAKAARKGVTK